MCANESGKQATSNVGDWPIPKWLTPKSKSRGLRARFRESYPGYTAYHDCQLRTRYMELEDIFSRCRCDRQSDMGSPAADGGASQSGNGNSRAVDTHIAGLLEKARELLERDPVDQLNAASALDFIERSMVRWHPHEMTREIGDVVLWALQHECTKDQKLQDDFQNIVDKSWVSPCNKDTEEITDIYRRVLCEAIEATQRQATDRYTSRGAQIRRLNSLRWEGVAAIAALIIAAPIIWGHGTNDVPWPWLHLIFPSLDMWDLTVRLGALGIALVGAVGGFLSGLLQMRNTTLTMYDYHERFALMSLKPVVGALVSLVLCILLSWDILPAINVASPGTYALVAFLAGFSEQYFLRLLNLKPDEQRDGRSPAGESSGGQAVPNIAPKPQGSNLAH